MLTRNDLETKEAGRFSFRQPVQDGAPAIYALVKRHTIDEVLIFSATMFNDGRDAQRDRIRVGSIGSAVKL